MRRGGARLALWTETLAGELRGLHVIGPTPGLVWAHGLGGSCDADSVRGIQDVVSPRALQRSVLRLDLRGHGRSGGAHDSVRGAEQYRWPELANDMRSAAQAAMSRAFFGGEAAGAAVALHAAAQAAAIKGGKGLDMPPGLVLVRPPAALAGSVSAAAWRGRCEAAAAAAEQGGWSAVEAWEAEGGTPLLDGAATLYAEDDGGALEKLRACRREMSPDAFAAALRGAAASAPLGEELQAMQGERKVDMAADAYGVPLTISSPVLILAVAGSADPDHPAEAAEALAARLPGSQLVVADDCAQARAEWPKRIGAFLKQAWMKEFLSKRVMPQ